MQTMRNGSDERNMLDFARKIYTFLQDQFAYFIFFNFDFVAAGCCLQNEMSLKRTISGEPVFSRNCVVRCATVAVFVGGGTTENRRNVYVEYSKFQPLTWAQFTSFKYWAKKIFKPKIISTFRLHSFHRSLLLTQFDCMLRPWFIMYLRNCVRATCYSFRPLRVRVCDRTPPIEHLWRMYCLPPE